MNNIMQNKKFTEISGWVGIGLFTIQFCTSDYVITRNGRNYPHRNHTFNYGWIILILDTLISN